MLQRLAGDGNVEPLKVLADVVEPVKDYQRHHWGNYSSDFPLTQLVDTARPESAAARHFRNTVNGYLSKAPALGDSKDIETSLELWKGNHKKLEPMLEKSDLLADALSQSQDLSSIAQVGLEAIQYLKSGKNAPPSWWDKTLPVLTRALQPKAQVEIAVLPSIYKLALAANQWDKLKSMSVEEWNKSLDTQFEAAKNPPKR
jgi:hexosaminidase